MNGRPPVRRGNRRAGWCAAAVATASLLVLAGHGLAQTYVNPIIAPVAADPSVVRAPDGTFYLVATQDRWPDGQEHRLPIFRSDDLVGWEFVADAFDAPPAWREGDGFLWAPELVRAEEGYRLYYAYSFWDDPNPCIGMASAPEPAGPWTDLGRNVLCSNDIGVPNSLDPFLWADASGEVLIWGSFHGIHAVRLRDHGTRPEGEPVRLADDRFEGAYVIRRDDRYYLFVSSGSCCDGANSGYTTWAGRSQDLWGPYLDSQGRDLRFGGGEVVLYRNDAWVGPGHVAVVQDDGGTDWLVYHAIDPVEPLLPGGATRRPALLDRIDWVEGWPVVHDLAGPSRTEQPAPVVSTP